MRKKVLVFPAGSEIGLEIHRALSLSKDIELFGVSSNTSNHGCYLYKNYIEINSFVDDGEFLSALNSIIQAEQIDFIFPAHDSVVLKLAENQDKLNCQLIGSPLETCRICRSKKNTYELFCNKIDVPKVYDHIDLDTFFPVFLKPEVGQGSKGTYLAQTFEEVEIFLRRDSSLMILEYLPGKEYTVDCFTDRFGNLRFVGARERIRISNGISAHTRPVTNESFSRIANIINNTLTFRGAWFFQLKERSNKEPVLLEIAPRIAGAMGLYRNLGVNFPLISIYDALNLDIEINYNTGFNLEMDRAFINRYKFDYDFKHVYIDLDDTVIIDNSVNSWMITFFYQCINKGIKIHLISRHNGDLKEYLVKHKIESIFDSITLLNRFEDKADFIKEKPAIFIDDSFSERFKVKQKLGLPTFDIDSIECLIDWRV